MKPDASLHNPKPRYIRGLLKAAGLTQAEAAQRIGISARTMRYYVSLDKTSYIPAPYAVQYCLERLASTR